MYKKKIRSLLFILVLSACLVVILVTLLLRGQKKQIEGTFITKEEAAILLEEFKIQPEWKYAEETFVTFEEYLLVEEQIIDPFEAKKIEELERFQDFYKPSHLMLWEDFLSAYLLYAGMLFPDSLICMDEFIVMGMDDSISDLEDVPQENGMLFAIDFQKEVLKEITLSYDTDGLKVQEEGSVSQKSMDDILYHKMSVIRNENRVILTLGIDTYDFTLEKAWVSSHSEAGIRVTFLGRQILLQNQNHVQVSNETEEIADIIFKDSKLDTVEIYKDKVNGKILSIRDNKIEIEGKGIYPYEDDMQVYKLYGIKEPYTVDHLKVGYDFTDFVLKDDMIVAGLVAREENMENIRVVIKTSGFAGVYHEQISFVSDADITLRYGDQEEEYAAGEAFEITEDSSWFKDNNRIVIMPHILTSRITVRSVERAQGTPKYRGSIEVEKTDKGLLLVNELLLEEYLYSVVPSEMPARYPLEALKAQAVSARTYAYKHMNQSGMRSYGAHVDDSVSFQVYNNINENESTTLAVRETKGEVMLLSQEPADIYYYSTSCGYGTDLSAWKSPESESTSHLQSKRISDIQEEIDLTQEEVFAAYINEVHEEDFESQEGWYRWTYTTSLDADLMLDQIKARYAATPGRVLTKDKQGEFISKDIGKLGDVLDIYPVKRTKGGAIEELIIEGEKATYKILTENSVRYVLTNTEKEVLLQTGDTSQVPSLIPSAFCTIEVTGDEMVEGYKLIGGGYGHGIGMSQNGARAMGERGYRYDEILCFFFDGITVVEQKSE